MRSAGVVRGLVVLGLIGFASFSAACSGHIHDPDLFLDPAKACPLADPYEDLIKPRCATSGCHAAVSPQAALDLSVNNPAALVQKDAVGCSNRVLVRSGTVNGVVLDKLSERPECGRQMPMDGNPLTQLERACVAAWIQGGGQ